MILTGPQCHAARALVQLTKQLLADKSGVDVAEIERFEGGAHDPDSETKRKLVTALEDCGAVLIWENGGGVGVRLKYDRRDARAVRKWESEGGPPRSDVV